MADIEITPFGDNRIAVRSPYGAKLGADVVILRGGFSSGGSRKNWRITVHPGTVFDLLRIPEAIAHRLEEQHPDHCRIVSPEGTEPIDIEAVANEPEGGA